MLNILHDLWLEFPPIDAPGFVTALIVAGLGSGLCLIKGKAKAWSALSVSLAVALCCFVSLIVVAIMGVLAVSAGTFGMARSWASFADAYVWGIFSLPFLTFILSLCGLALTSRIWREPHNKETDR